MGKGEGERRKGKGKGIGERERRKGNGTVKGERRKGKGTGFFFGNSKLWFAPFIGCACVPFVKGKGKEEGKEKGEQGKRKEEGKGERQRRTEKRIFYVSQANCAIDSAQLLCVCVHLGVDCPISVSFSGGTVVIYSSLCAFYVSQSELRHLQCTVSVCVCVCVHMI